MRMIVNIDVPELAPAIDFYTAALGLTLNRIIDGDVAELSGASATLYLLATPPARTPCARSRWNATTPDTGHRFTWTSSWLT